MIDYFLHRCNDCQRRPEAPKIQCKAIDLRLGRRDGENAITILVSNDGTAPLANCVVDDLLDVTQTTQHLGKTAGKDAEQDKLTYVALLGLDGAPVLTCEEFVLP